MPRRQRPGARAKIRKLPNKQNCLCLRLRSAIPPRKTQSSVGSGWLAQYPKVHFHYTPTHASWLNQVEVWFSILSRQALRGANLHSVRELREKIDAFVKAYNQTAAPFEWTKVNVAPKTLAHKYVNLCN
jgi:hypothetical protein